MAFTTINKSTDYFNTKLYTGDGSSSRNITGVGFQPDLLWIKNRDATQYHFVFDAVRGVSKAIFPNATDAESTQASTQTAFLSDGFTVGNDAASNGNGNGIASWNWKANGAGSANTDGSISSTVSANTTSGFSIVKWTSTSGADTVGHGLGVTPQIVLTKTLGITENWTFHTTIIDGTNDYLYLNTSGVSGNSSYAVPTSSIFNFNYGSAQNFISYVFAEKQGYSKFGSYVGNGNDDGTFIYTGFKPAFIMIKATGLTENWWIMDSKRSPSNVVQNLLQANLSNAELVGNVNFKFDMLSNGFKLRDVDGAYNSSGQNYIYMAFAEAPLVGTNNVPANAR